MHFTSKHNSKGFTLLEILLVVGIIAILAGIVIIAINPTKQLGTTRNTERKSDIKQIDSALKQYYIDHNHFPTTTPDALTEICDTGTSTYPDMYSTCSGNGLIDLSMLVPTYLTAIPKDPQATLRAPPGNRRANSMTVGMKALNSKKTPYSSAHTHTDKEEVLFMLPAAAPDPDPSSPQAIFDPAGGRKIARTARRASTQEEDRRQKLGPRRAPTMRPRSAHPQITSPSPEKNTAVPCRPGDQSEGRAKRGEGERS